MSQMIEFLECREQGDVCLDNGADNGCSEWDYQADYNCYVPGSYTDNHCTAGEFSQLCEMSCV